MSDPSAIQPSRGVPAYVPPASAMPWHALGASPVEARINPRHVIKAIEQTANVVRVTIRTLAAIDITRARPFVRPTSGAWLYLGPEAIGGFARNEWFHISPHIGPMSAAGALVDSDIRHEALRAQRLYERGRAISEEAKMRDRYARMSTDQVLEQMSHARNAPFQFVPHVRISPDEYRIAVDTLRQRGIELSPAAALLIEQREGYARGSLTEGRDDPTSPYAGAWDHGTPSGYIEWPEGGTGLIDDLLATMPPDP